MYLSDLKKIISQLFDVGEVVSVSSRVFVYNIKLIREGKIYPLLNTLEKSQGLILEDTELQVTMTTERRGEEEEEEREGRE